MSDPRILILGAGRAGLRAAGRARRLMPRAAITVVDRRPHIGTGADALACYLGGEVERPESLRETSYGARCDAEFFRRVKDVEVLVGQDVVAIDRDARAVTVDDVDEPGRRTMLLYDRLVYALGAGPRVPAGFEPGPAVTTMATIEDAAALRGEVQSGRTASVIVVGGGRAGTAIAVALADLWGCAVTLLEASGRLLPRMLDDDLGLLAAAALARAGVTVRLGCAATAASTRDGRAVVSVAEDPGRGGARTGSLTADRAVLALGTSPRSGLARAAGLAVGELGGLLVDACLRTSDPDILAAGDCLELVHHVSGAMCRSPLGVSAARQGRVAAEVLAGRDSEFAAVVGSRALEVFDLNVAATGLTAAAALAAGLEPVVTSGAFADRLHVHPDQALVHLQLVHEADSGRLLGLQAAGPGDAVKRVDLFAAHLKQDAGLEELLEAECCGAPAYNAPLDPLQDLAAVALAHREGAAVQVGPGWEPDGRLVLDVRTAAELAGQPDSVLPGALNIPLAELRSRLDELPGDRPLLVVCAKGGRSAEAARLLGQRGFTDVVYLAGGMALRGAMRPADRPGA